ncbi:MAG: phage holin family protein [Thermoleophilaceae bacterium]
MPRRRVGPRAIARVLIVWVITAGALMLMSALLARFDVDDAASALGSAALIGLINALVWPVVIRIALPFTVLTLGLGVLVLNGLVVMFVSDVDPGVQIDGLGTSIAVAVGLTVVNTAVTSLLAIDDDDFWYRNIVKRRVRKLRPEGDMSVPGVYFLEIDGLAHDVLRRAIRDGNAPNLANWVHDGSHHLLRWETDWSSQTGACQAGLLHGDNDDIPAFRWWEKDRGRPIVTNHPRDAAEIERRHSDGRGLLHADGASRANIVSGDAVHTLLTMSTVLDRNRPGRMGQDYFAYFANPYSVTRTVALVIADIVQERHFAAQQRRRDVRPRIHRDRKYAIVRAWGTIVQTDLQVQAVIADMYAGRPVGYSTFLAYDEVAHHSGVERTDALAVLRRVDRQIGRIAAAARDAARPYEIVILSDHGQSQGATFLQRFGVSLEEIVRRACDTQSIDVEHAHSDEALGYLSASLTEASGADSASGRAVHAATRRRKVDGAVQLGEEPRSEEADAELPELSVMASGCLGLITFPREDGRVTLEQIEARWPALIPTLREHPGIGFLLVRSERHGAVVLGPQGVNYLDERRVEGEDPLAPFGPNAARHVKRTDGFPHCADIMLNSAYWPETDEVAAFEELVGSHGGMGGAQSFPFALVPAGWRQPEEPAIGAEALHAHFRSWLAELGHDSYRDLREPERATT